MKARCGPIRGRYEPAIFPAKGIPGKGDSPIFADAKIGAVPEKRVHDGLTQPMKKASNRCRSKKGTACRSGGRSDRGENNRGGKGSGNSAAEKAAEKKR